MLFNDLSNPLLVLVGPTAVGKTALSITLAERLGAEIISADSRLFYRGMDIGTAKPTLEERRRVPHHLIDLADPDDIWNLSKFQRSVYEIIPQIHSRCNLPMLVGGTGQYIFSVIKGWNIPPQKPDNALRDALMLWAEKIGSHELHRRLAIVDAAAASFIEPNNLRRTVRALEVIFRTGKPFSQQRRTSEVPYTLCVVGLKRAREELYNRIDERIEAMMANKFLEEVQTLLALGYSAELPSLSAIGYRQMANYINSEMTYDEAITEIKRLTRQFVRRQANWFKESDPEIQWFQVNENVVDDIERFLQTREAWRAAK